MDELDIVTLGIILTYIVSYGWLVLEIIKKMKSYGVLSALSVFISLNSILYITYGTDLAVFLFGVLSVLYTIVGVVIGIRLWLYDKFG